ncbi:MAG: ABC transporter ATP-binding protein, partial [Firmicutes bacterium]|nr:ABC transporter ATP-binding protein [Bacillota bacterium]
MIKIKNAVKVYDKGMSKESVALDDVSMELPDCGFVSVVGKSGCGKTTLVHCLAGLDVLDSGKIIVDDDNLAQFGKEQMDAYRNTHIGIVFQEFHCLDDWTVNHNVELALRLQGKSDWGNRVEKVLEQVGLQGLGERKITELSGGQKQRVAIARALVKGSKVLLCDEPTGNLDESTGEQIFDLLKKISESALVIVVSHDLDSVRKYSDRIIEIKAGKVVSDQVLSVAKSTGMQAEVVQV